MTQAKGEGRLGWHHLSSELCLYLPVEKKLVVLVMQFLSSKGRAKFCFLSDTFCRIGRLDWIPAYLILAEEEDVETHLLRLWRSG